MLNLTDVIESLFFEGSLGEIDRDGDLYKMLKGMGANHEDIYAFLKTLAHIRVPRLTPYLADLEKEYGLLTNTSMTEAERREYLHGVVYAPRSPGTAEYLEDQLQNAGFPVQVHANSPAVDPALFYGGAGGEMITNNENYDRTITEARADRNVWSYVFIIGGDAVRDADGSLLAVAPAPVASNVRSLFRELVLKYKPVHSWGVAVIHEDWDYFTFSENDDLTTDAPRGFADDEQSAGGFWWEDSFAPPLLIDDVTLEFIVDGVSGDYLTEE